LAADGRIMLRQRAADHGSTSASRTATEVDAREQAVAAKEVGLVVLVRLGMQR